MLGGATKHGGQFDNCRLQGGKPPLSTTKKEGTQVPSKIKTDFLVPLFGVILVDKLFDLCH